jgi:hypothetical protein
MPTVAATSSGSLGTTAQKAHTISLPTGISAGNLLIVFIALNGTPILNTNDSGWTFFNSAQWTGQIKMMGLWKYADGTETDFSFEMLSDCKGAYVAYRITGGWAPAYGSGAGSGGYPDSPNATHPDGALANLFLSVGATLNDAVADAAPTNYGSLITAQGDTTGAASVSAGQRDLTSASDNPGSFDFTSTSYNSYWAVYTVVVSPKARLEPLDFEGPLIDLEPIDIGHIYTLHPYKLTGPTLSLPQLNVYSGKLTPLPLTGPVAVLDQPAFGQVHALSANDLVGPIMQLGTPTAVDNTNIGSDQFLFAWVSASETSFGIAHHRNDENIFAFDLTHTEGDFATLSVDVINPHVGLLGPTRKKWVWLSWNNGGTVEPLFFGRLVGVPQAMQGEIVRLEFIARPVGYEAVKAALADTMRVRPYYDAMWYSEDARLEPDTVLEGRPELWHIDRITHQVSSSNVLVGEDGTVDFGTNHFYDSLNVSYSQSPGRLAKVNVTVAWRQLALGYVDISKAFPTYIQSMTWAGLLEDWPAPGDNIGGGWEVWDVSKVKVSGYPGGVTFRMSLGGSHSYIGGTFYTVRLSGTTAEYQSWKIANGDQANFEVGEIRAHMVLKYDVSREYAEVATFTLEADVQPLLTEPGDEEIITINMSANADDPADAQEGTDELAAPIGDLASYTFFHQPRGREALEHVVCVARSQLMARARAIDISCEVPFAAGVDLSCRKNVKVDDPRLPGGTATGKVFSYTLSLDGDSGQATAIINLGCTIGNGNTASTDPGSPTYVAEGYVDSGFQHYTAKADLLVSGDVTLTDYSDVPIVDDGIRFDTLTWQDVVEELSIINPAATQANAVDGLSSLITYGQAVSLSEMAEKINEYYTEVFLDVINLEENAPFESPFAITLSTLKLPKTIDLEAT